MSFAALGVAPSLVESLDRLSITEPTSVQRVAIPAQSGGRSLVVVAQTGSGKTLAYGVPLLQRLREIEDAEGVVTERGRPRGLVLTATRELVEQTTTALKSVAHGVKLRVRAVSGGQGGRETGQRLKDPADVLVANPPRLRALLDQGLVSLADVRVCVLDEADTLCAPGEKATVDALLLRLPPTTQVALYSATLPEAIRHWALTLPQKPTLLLAKDAHIAPATVRIHNIRTRPSERADAAHDALVAMARDSRGILFANRRETADEAAQILTERGHAVIVVHGGQLPRERRAHLDAFRAGTGRILVTTELGGRGLDLVGLTFVMNWELPERPSEYLHRIGRVGRQGAKGDVYNLVTEGDATLMKEVERLTRGGRLDTGEALRAPRVRPPKPGPGETVRRAAPKGNAPRSAPKHNPKSGGKSDPPPRKRPTERGAGERRIGHKSGRKA